MKRSILTAMSAAAFLVAIQAQAADAPPRRPSLPIAGVITRPDWVSRPSGADVSRYYPLLAMRMEQAGLVLLQCSVTAEGTMENCSAVEEAPLGLGFADGALRMASLFKMKPQTVNGVAVSGGVVRIPITFRLGGDDPPPPSPQLGPAPSAGALALANRLVAALKIADQSKRFSNGRLTQTLASAPAPSSPADSAAQKAAQDALAEAGQAYAERYAAIYAEVIARRVPEPDLAKITAFYESSAGQAWLNGQQAITAEMPEASRAATEEVTINARRRFCTEVACGEFAPNPAPNSAAQGAKP